MHKFSYGDRKVKYKNSNMYVEPVDNLHDLTFYEMYLDSISIPWCVYVVSTESGCKFALIANEGLVS